jgi:hypothetical protein
MSFDPWRVLGRPIGVVVSDKSGAAGIAWWVNEHFHLTGTQKIAKSDPGIQAMYQELLKSYAAGRTADPSSDELQALARHHMPALQTIS